MRTGPGAAPCTFGVGGAGNWPVPQEDMSVAVNECTQQCVNMSGTTEF